MSNDRLTKRIMEGGKPRNRKRGRSRRKWLDQIEEHGRKKGKTKEEMKTLARDRRAWKEWVKEDRDRDRDSQSDA